MAIDTVCCCAAQVGVIDTGISLNHQDLQRNVNKNCQDFVNGDDSCDEGRIPGNSKGTLLWHSALHTLLSQPMNGSSCAAGLFIPVRAVPGIQVPVLGPAGRPVNCRDEISHDCSAVD